MCGVRETNDKCLQREVLKNKYVKDGDFDSLEAVSKNKKSGHVENLAEPIALS